MASAFTLSSTSVRWTNRARSALLSMISITSVNFLSSLYVSVFPQNLGTASDGARQRREDRRPVLPVPSGRVEQDHRALAQRPDVPGRGCLVGVDAVTKPLIGQGVLPLLVRPRQVPGVGPCLGGQGNYREYPEGGNPHRAPGRDDEHDDEHHHSGYRNDHT